MRCLICGLTSSKAGKAASRRVFQADDVPAELALHRRVGHLALLQLGHRAAEFRHVGVGLGEVEVAAVGAGARVLGVLLGQFLEAGAALDLGDQGLGLVLALDQDVAGAVFGAAGLGLELVVLGLRLGIGDGVLLAVVVEQLADQHALARQFHPRLVVGLSRDAALLGLLHEDLAQHDLVARLRLHLGGDLLAGARGFLQQHVHARLGHGLAVDDGDVLGGGAEGQQRGRPRPG